MLSHPELWGGVKRFVRGPIDRQRWLFRAEAGEATVDVCFDARGSFYDGRFVSPGCGLFACAGVVAQVHQSGVRWTAWTQCGGRCPCAAVVDATVVTASMLAGSYAAAHCNGSSSGAFVAERAAWPGGR